MFSASGGGGGIQARTGSELQEIQSEAVGFLAVGGETKVRLLPSPWPADALPSPTSSLLSIASRNGLIAAAGPDQLVIGTTDAVRDTFKKSPPGDNNINPFTPQLSIPIPTVSQVVFSSDESSLTICAAQGGGLAVYEVQALKQGNTEPAFQIGTNGISVRALIPNPAEETAHILAIVLSSGQLMLANLKERQLMNGPNGYVLREGVSCVSWSARGKQLVAGLGSGEAIQMAPDGSVKAEIPRPPGLEGDQHMSTISWLSNDEFLAIYTPTKSSYDNVPDSTFVLISREPKTSNFTFQKMQDPCGVFGLNRSPPHHFIARLRSFPPDLQDVLIVSSTASGDIGLVTNSAKPLSSEANATNNNKKYLTTLLANDASRAQLPMGDMGDMSDTSPIGFALDLSSKEPVKKPIPAEEIDASSTPLPALVVLNHEGLLSSWWFVYSDSVKQGTIFPGLVAAPPTAATSPQRQQAPQQSGFGAIGQSNGGFGTSAVSTSVFGNSTSKPAFGSPSTPSPSTFGSAAAFGGSSALGTRQSAWGSAGISTTTPQTTGATFGQSSFGNPTPVGGAGGAFGAASNIGNRQSPWASANNQQPSSTAENKPNPFSGALASATSPFASMAGNQASQSGFASLAGGSSGDAASPFGGLGQSQKSIFASGQSTKPPVMPAEPSFGSEVTLPSTLGSSFGTMGTKSPWLTPSLSSDNSNKSTFNAPQSQEADMSTGDMETESNTTQKPAENEQKKEEAPQSLFGVSGSGFKLGSTFKPEDTANDDLPKPEGNSLFGPGFGKALGDIQKKPEQDVPIKKEPDDSTGIKLPPIQTPIKQEPQDSSQIQLPSTTPQSPPKQSTSQAPQDTAAEPEPAPLPPSPTSEQAPVLPDPPLPPSPKAQETVAEPAPLPPSPNLQAEAEPAPLPPSPKPLAENKEDVPSPAGTSPVDLGASDESFLSGGSGDGGEAEKKSPDAPASGHLQQPTWSFPSAPKSPENSEQNHATTPESTQTSYTPASAPQQSVTGSIKPPLFFPRPGAGQESPRSPSPVRNQQHAFALASSTPSKPPQQQPSTTPLAPPPKKAPQSTVKPLFPSRLAPVEEARSEKSSRAGSDFGSQTAETEPEEEDDSERIRAELASPVHATKRLEPFIAHRDYTGAVAGQGVPAQIEKVYRDINSMVDTLGLNARALKAFIKGHTEMFPDGGRERADLEREDDWCLLEIEDLGIVQKELADRLDSERPQDVPDKLKDLREVLKDLSKLHARHADIQRTISQFNNPDDSASGQKSRLSTEQSQRLADLRRDFTAVQTSLAQAEDSASLLRAKLASHQSSANGSGAKVPTVEAIVNTIAKMTRMAEEKSGDVDLLEAKMRKLGFRPTSARSRNLDDALGAMSLNGRSSVTSTSTPPRSLEAARKKKQASPGTYTFDYSDSDDDDEDEDEFVDVQSDAALRSSTRSTGSASMRASLSPGKSLSRSGVMVQQPTEEELLEYEAKMKHRKNVLGLLRERVLERGVQKK